MFLLRRVPAVERFQEHHEGGGLVALRPYARPLALLYFIVVLVSLSVFLIAVGVGGFFGGPAADRIGARRVIILSLLSSVPFLMVAPLLVGWPFGVALAIGGFLLQSTLPVNVTFGQSIAPISAATVSSLMMGFAWGWGGLAVPMVGIAAHRIGIERALVVMSALPLVAALPAVPLPSRTQVHVVARPTSMTTAES